MHIFLLLASFALFVFLSVPIGVSIGMALCLYGFAGGSMGLDFISQAIFSSMNSFPLIAIPFFILAGTLMEGGGLSKRLINLSNSLVGHFTGGLGIVTVLTCIFFGAISGSAIATVAAVGTIMIPAMEEQGYPRSFATALAAAAGVLGTIIPPSIPMIMYCVALPAASPGNMFMGGIGPGLLAGVTLMILVCYYAKRNGYRSTNTEFNFKNVIKCTIDAIWALFVPLIIIGGIYGGIFSATEAAVVACVYGFIVGKFIYKELSMNATSKALVSSAITVSSILIVVATGSVLGKILTVEGIPKMVETALTSLSSNVYVLLIVINIILLIVGCIMETFTAIIILSPILYPIVAQYGIDVYHFGVMMILNLSIGFITPPVGSNLFVACGITGMRFETLVKSIWPFLLALIAALILVTFIPQITLFLPNLFGM
ncbi:C4-dicarboxylate transporter, DctM subunit [Geosporobacter subterraneus DSM 17957]|uniref:C4-dicarboxylate transporter, DctM subunit n=1 Tax=Geosporobacter subterraneus DSM 17957 TaxID=1121919 RepID=A0A1M6HZV7_9FIRM|nr:TRAP transporter large permease [Geosporobacter subterraneus]SHJ27766.1 C4-dicarboxylate transporter, DctM subunit [Geosporobacter subterraneus DSM 17957]